MAKISYIIYTPKAVRIMFLLYMVSNAKMPLRAERHFCK